MDSTNSLLAQVLDAEAPEKRMEIKIVAMQASDSMNLLQSCSWSMPVSGRRSENDFPRNVSKSPLGMQTVLDTDESN